MPHTPAFREPLDGSSVLGSADLHLHTLASDGLVSARDLVDYVEHNTDLDVIAVTDHDEISAALDAREWAARKGYRVQVVPGVEVSTRNGHFLTLFVEERPPALRPLHETAVWVRERGGICIAPHPFTRWTHSVHGRPLHRLVTEGLLLGVEVLNSSPAGRASRPHALRFAADHGLAAIGASDAHMIGCVGLARTRFPGTSPSNLRLALENGSTWAEGRHARVGEIAAEALPQLARSMVHLPLRRLSRLRPTAGEWIARTSVRQAMLQLRSHQS